jgi:hypothetical protein
MTVDGDPLVETIHFVAEGVSTPRQGEPAPVPKIPSKTILTRKEGPLIKVGKGHHTSAAGSRARVWNERRFDATCSEPVGLCSRQGESPRLRAISDGATAIVR